MKTRKKLLCLFLAVLMPIVCLYESVAASSAAAISDSINAAEIERAVNLEIVPKSMQSDYMKNATQKELYTLLNNCIKMKTGKPNPEWTKMTDAASSKDEINRQQTAVLIYRAALLLGISDKDICINSKLYFQSKKLDKKLVEECIKDPNLISTNVIPFEYLDVAKCLNEWSQYAFEQDGGILYNALAYVTGEGDAISGKKIMEITEDYRFRPRENTTRAEAILAVYRLYNSIEEKPKYVKLEDVGMNTIPVSLITKDSKLPDATNNKLPQWKGVGITNKAASANGALFSNEDKNFHENEIKFISDSGFNFIRVFFSFSTLGYPDYPEDMVNEVELRELDQLIGWGMKYDVHICLCMEGQPEMGKEPFPAEIMTGDFFTNAKKQENVKKYWQMLSKRYANIPNKYLSFNLMNEPESPSDKVQTMVFKPIVEAIWKECPNRVIIADCTGTSCEGLAKMGVALSYHFYSPNVVCYNGMDFLTSEFPYLEPPKWPLIYLPGCLHSDSSCDTIIIDGKFNKGSIGIYVYDVLGDGDAMVTITADNETILKKKVTGTNRLSADRNVVQREYVAEFPEGTMKLKIKAEGCFRYGRIQIKQLGKKDINMYPHDLWENDWNAISPKIIVHDDGSCENNNSPKKVVDWNELYKWIIKEHKDVAEKNNVGFMIGEFGPFGKPLPKSTLFNYMDTVLEGLNSSGLAWCNGGFIGDGYIASFVPYSDEYRFSKLPDSDLYINEDLLSIYRKYLKKDATTLKK